MRSLAPFVVLVPLAAGCALVHERPPREEPPPPPIVPDALTVSARGSLTCAIGVDERVRCWGQYLGTVGSVEHDAGAAPTRIEGLEGITAIAVTPDHVCAVDHAGAVWCWGFGSSAQLGLPPVDSSVFRAEPTRVAGLPPARDVSVGNYFSCALLEDGGVACWGDDGLSELPVAVDVGSRSPHSATPVRAPDEVHDVVQLTSYATGSCARGAGGETWCWGENAFGEMGPLDGARVHRIDVPPLVDLGLAGGKSFGLAADGTVYRWGGVHVTGSVYFLDPGDGTSSVVGHLSGVDRLIAIEPHVCGLRPSGDLDCIDEVRISAVDLPEVELVLAALPPARAVAVGFRHACALDLEGHLTCVGENGLGQLGQGTRGDRFVHDETVFTDLPVTIDDARQLVRGADFACALAQDAAWCWGGNLEGDVGVGAPEHLPVASPRRVALEAVTDLDARGLHACAVAGGRVACWGSNEHGESAPGAPGPLTVPAFVTLAAPADEVAVTVDASCARLGGEVWCWGNDERGQTSDPGFAERTLPTHVPLDEPALAIVAGDAHVCALVASGTVACWGENHDLQVGAPPCDEACLARIRAHDAEHAHVIEHPRPVPGVTGVTQLLASAQTTCAIGATEVTCWGRQHEVLRPLPRRDPVLLDEGGVVCSGTPLTCGDLDPAMDEYAITPSTGLRAGNFDAYFGCLLDDAGAVRCDGAGARGQLGTGDGYAADPVPVRL